MKHLKALYKHFIMKMIPKEGFLWNLVAAAGEKQQGRPGLPKKCPKWKGSAHPSYASKENRAIPKEDKFLQFL